MDGNGGGIMSVKKIAAIYMVVVVLLSGCGQKLVDTTTLVKVKDIELKEEDIKTADDTEDILKNSTTVNIAGTEISLSCPEDWDVRAGENSDSKDNRITASHWEVPVYDLSVELEHDLCDKHGTNLANVLMATIDNLDRSTMSKNDKIIPFIEEAYTYYIQKDPLYQKIYGTWTEISPFEQKTFQKQCYIVMKGKLKMKGKKRERGVCWYITIRDGKLIAYKFIADNTNIDNSVISVFEKIMNTVTYKSVSGDKSSLHEEVNSAMTLDEYLKNKDKTTVHITLKLIGADKLKKADTIIIYKDNGDKLDKMAEFKSDQYQNEKIKLQINKDYVITSSINKKGTVTIINVDARDEGNTLVLNYNKKKIFLKN